MRYYVAANTECGCLIVCEHQHKTVASATACFPEPGAHVIAVRRGKFSELTDKEEKEFQFARYGKAEKHKAKEPSFAPDPAPENEF
jgi:hypothetical protein